MRRLTLSFAVAFGLALPLIGGCISIGGKVEKVEKKDGDVRVEKETRTHTKTEVETVRP